MNGDRAMVIVAHPDDEILWAGGLILSLPDVHWHIISLSRHNDPDRAPRFARILHTLGATGTMGHLDDGPEQKPLAAFDVQQAILEQVPPNHYDLILTHGPQGEYTRHRRHEETFRAVADLWQNQQLSANSELWLFAYEDGSRQYLPRAMTSAHVQLTLPEELWKTKYRLVTEIYGFAPTSWEAQVTPRAEAFWRFSSATALQHWLQDWQ